MSLSERQRLDKWLWFARVVKTRTLAARLVSDGHVRINGTRQDAPSKQVSPGDVLTIALERQVRVLKVIAAGVRRGPFDEARLLFEDLSEPAVSPNPEEAVPASEPGKGRPTKKDRRDLEKFRGD